MATTDPLGGGIQAMTGADVIALADEKVNLKDVVPALFQFIVHMGYVHRVLFGDPLVVTSGVDGAHSPNSLHAAGKAVDLRTKDLSEDEQLLFLTVLLWAAPIRECTVFDERALPGAGHVHVEYHGG